MFGKPVKAKIEAELALVFKIALLEYLFIFFI
jgi:hypothetical protein